jgi:hypothetical protein
MDTTDVLIVMTAVGGLTLTIGGLILLMRGAVSLTRCPDSDGAARGLDFQFQGLKLTTDYPAIAIFALGLIFFGLALWSESQRTDSITITGRLENILPRDATVYAAVPLIPVMSKSDGTIDYQLSIRPQHTDVWAVVVTPGRDPSFNLDSTPLQRTSVIGSAGRADFEDLPVGELVRAMPAVSTVEPVAAQLPGLSAPLGLKP